MNIFKEIKESVYSPRYYANISEEKFSSSLSYFISLALIVSVISTACITFRILPIVKTGLNNFGPEIVKRFPEDLILTIRDKQISTNREEPVIIPFAIESSTAQLPQNFLVIDTKNVFTETRFREANTLLYLTKDTVYAANEEGGVGGSEKLELPDLTINQVRILEWLHDAKGLLIWLPFALVFIIFFISLWFPILILLELLVVALAIMAASRIKKKPVSYKTAYQLSLHATTVRLLLFVSIFIIPILAPVMFLPFFGVLISFLVYWVNVSSGGATSQHETSV